MVLTASKLFLWIAALLLAVAFLVLVVPALATISVVAVLILAAFFWMLSKAVA